MHRYLGLYSYVNACKTGSNDEFVCPMRTVRCVGQRIVVTQRAGKVSEICNVALVYENFVDNPVVDVIYFIE